MIEQRNHRLRKPKFTTFEFYRLMDTYVHAAEEITGRPWRLAGDALRRSMRRVEASLLGPWSAKQLAIGLAEEYANLMLGMLTAVPTALQEITTRLNNPPAGTMSEYRVSIEGAHPEERGTLIRVGDKEDTPFIVPARILDASQGWAAWFVPTEKVVALINCGIASNRIDSAIAEDFEPLDCGGGRSMVVLLGVDYRVSDSGQYREIALAVCITPKEEAAAQPGALFARLVVSDRFSIAPTKRMWGFHKDFFEDLQVYYGKVYAQFYTGQGAEGDFFLTVPRFGSGRSFDIPMVLYSVRGADPVDGVAGSVRSVMKRSGAGEGVQIGGTVELQLGRRPTPDENGNLSGHCFCSDPGVPCLCDELRLLGIDQTLPAANGWTERMTGMIGAPGPLGLHPFGNH
jgi:hypothetical protein